MADTNELSERELEILLLVATGASNKEIAQQLHISSNTVKVHLRNIFAKIGVASRTEAAMYAVQNGLVGDVVKEGSPEGGAAEPGDGVEPSLSRNWTPIIGIILLVLALGLLGLFAAYQTGMFDGLAGNDPQPAELPRWEARSEMSIERQGLAAVAYENHIFAIGGESAGGVVGEVGRYSLDTDSWETLADKPTAVSDVRGVVIGGKIYVPGGRMPSGDLTDVLEIYDPREDLWEVGARLPLGLSAYALVPFEGQLYLFGGWDGERYRGEVFAYDTDEDRWQEKTAMPTGRAFAGAAVAGERIFVIGGQNEDGILAVNEVYSPVEDESGAIPWTLGTELPEGRFGHGAVSIADIVYVIGGKGNGNVGLPSLQYFFQAEEWQRFETPFDDAWWDFGMAASGSHLYVLGGRLDNVILANNLAFRAIYTVSIPLVE